MKVSQAALTFGSTVSLTSGERFAGTHLQSGVSLYLKKLADENDGVHGIIPKVIFLDDEYTPEKAKLNAQHFLADGIYKTISSYGTPTLAAYLDLVKQRKLAVFFPTTGTTIFRNPELKYIVNLRNSDSNEARIAVERALDADKAQKIVFFVQNDEYGKGAFEGAQLVAKQRNIDYQKEWKVVYYKRAQVNLTEQAHEIEEYNPDALIFLSTVTPTKELIRLLGSSYLVKKKLYGISVLGQSVFKTFAQENGLRVVVMNSIPNPNGKAIKVVNEFREYANKNSVEIDVITLEGYLGMAVMVDTIKKIQGEITNESIITQLEQIKDYDYKGLRLNFNKETRELLNEIWIDTGEGDWKQVSVDVPQKKDVNVNEKK